MYESTLSNAPAISRKMVAIGDWFRKPVLIEVIRVAKLLSQALKDLKSDCDCGKMGLNSTYQFSL